MEIARIMNFKICFIPTFLLFLPLLHHAVITSGVPGILSTYNSV